MSVVKRKRKESPFEVFHHLTKMRQNITDLLLRDFGYSNEKFQKKIERRYGGKKFEELTDVQKKDYERQKEENMLAKLIGQSLYFPPEGADEEAGEVALHPDTGYPKECMTNYDGAIQTDWTIDTASLWKPWHSTDPDYALPFEHPTGAHDIYKAGEYMIWTDGDIKKCIQDTSYSPDEYAQAWE